MVTFEAGELEIAMITYNRCEFVADWLNSNYSEMKKRNIHFSIYDSSTNNDTEFYIQHFMERENDSEIEYHRVDSNIGAAAKPLLPLRKSQFKYVWVVGDSRYWDYVMLDCEVFPYLKQDIDCVVCYLAGNDEKANKIYTSMQEFISAAIVSLTCSGATIYKTSIFEPLKENKKLIAECDKKYKNNYGFEWLGYFFEMLLLKNYRAYYALTSPPILIRPEQKKPVWVHRYYHCWIEDLQAVLDGIADRCQGTDVIMRTHWNWWNLDSPKECWYGRKYGDLNPETYTKFKQNGMLDACSDHVDRMRRFAYVEDVDLDSLLEEELEDVNRQFKDLCCQNVKRIREDSKNQQLWIYGAGSGGKILAECLMEANIPICGFLDKQAKLIENCMGILVKTIEEVELKNAYIIISMRDFTGRCITPLLKAGVKRKQIFYPVVDCAPRLS